MELVQTFQPYIIENRDYLAVHYSRVDKFPLPPPVNEMSILDVLNTQQFRNILIQKWMISTDLLSEYRDQLDEKWLLVTESGHRRKKMNQQ